MGLSNTNKVLALSFGKVLTSIIGVISGMVLARLLTVHEYATYRQTILVYSFVVPFITLGLPDAIYFFLSGEKHRKRGIINDNLFLLFIMGSIFAIFIWCGGNILWAKRFGNPKLIETLRIFAPYAIFALPLAAISATMVVQNKVKELTIFNVFSRIFLFICVITAAFVFGNVISLVSAELISATVVFVVILILMYKYVPNDNGRLQRKGMWQMLKYSVPLGLSAMLGTISVQLDQVIVSSMCSPEQYAVYANGTMEIPIIGMITGSIASIILVEMRKSIVDGNTNSALEMFRKAALRSSPILIPVMIFLLCMAKPFIEIIYSSKYVDSIDTFRIYLLMLPARIVYYSSALLAFGLTRVVLFRSALSLLFNAILSIILVHFFGYFGAIISFIIVLYFWDVSYNFIILSDKFKCKWHHLLPLKEIGKISIISVICGILIVPFIFLKMNNILSLLISGIIFFPLSYYLMLRFKLIELNWRQIQSKIKIWQK